VARRTSLLVESARLFREPQLKLLFAAQAISVFGDMLVPVALAFAVLGLTGSPSDLGLVLFARFLPMVAFFLVGGVYGDRFERRSVMIASNLANLVFQALLGTLLVTGHAQIWEVVALSAAKGTATAFFLPAANSIVPQLVPADRVQPAYGLLATVQSAASVIGPAVAGVLVATVGAGWAILGDAATFAVASALLARLDRLGRPARVEGATFFRDLRTGWQEVRTRTWLWVVIVSSGVFQLVVLAAVNVLGPVVATRSLGGAGAWTAIVVALGVGSVLGGIASVHLRPRRPLRTGYLLMLAAGGPSLVLLALPAPVPLIALAELGTGFSIGVMGTLETTLLADKIPSEALARVHAYDWLGSMALRPLGLAAIGPIAEVAGIRETLLAAAAITFCVILWPLAYPSVRNLRAGRDEPQQALTSDPLIA
jgi:MFS family permease